MVQAVSPLTKPDIASKPFFMKYGRLPSILSFSTILCFYGGKAEMRALLLQLAKGGRHFYESKVKLGYFFKTTIMYSNHINLNVEIIEMYEAAKKRCRKSKFVPEEEKYAAARPGELLEIQHY